jgi:peptidoglycan/LPS O-acetylase OafA/YrhL
MINQYSFILLALAFSIVAGFILLNNKPRWNDFLAFAVVVVGFVTAWLVLHPVQTPLMDNAKKVQSMIGAGKPVLLHFQSPY